MENVVVTNTSPALIGRVEIAKQQTFAGLAWENKGKQTRRERFLAEMDAISPWAQLLELIEPHCPKAGNGRPPLGREKMLRIYFLHIWFNLSDPGAEEALYDSESMTRDSFESNCRPTRFRTKARFSTSGTCSKSMT